MKLTVSIVFLALTAVVVNAADPQADNTQINGRDKYLHEYTAGSQGINKEDTNITRLIRQELIRDKTLSVYAQNVKIITINGQVTLKGPVRSAVEVKNIMAKAQSIAGVSSVLNQMDVTAKSK